MGLLIVSARFVSGGLVVRVGLLILYRDKVLDNLRFGDQLT